MNTTENVNVGDKVRVGVCTKPRSSEYTVTKVTPKTITIDWCGQSRTFRFHRGFWWSNVLAFDLTTDLVKA